MSVSNVKKQRTSAPTLGGLAIAVSLGLIGCDQGGKEERATPEVKPATPAEAAPEKSAEEKAKEAAAEEAKKAAAEAEKLAKEAAKKHILKPATKDVPSNEEFDAMKKEVAVKGSTALHCETKVVGEYLRVFCRGENDKGGKPQTIRIDDAGDIEYFTKSAPGELTLIIPYVNGVNFEATFAWTDRSHLFVAEWPNGAPRPQILAHFEGAASPIDARLEMAAQANLCKCFEEVVGGSCDQMGIGFTANPDCDRTYKGQCSSLLGCSQMGGAHHSPPKCQGKKVNAGLDRWCHKKCMSDADCSHGLKCGQSQGTDPKACLPKGWLM